MSNSQLYNDFFEGNLDTSHEYEFMELLRTDEDFRSGLKGYVSVSNTINSNIKLFGPSTQETSELYSKLGFTIPAVLEPYQQTTINKTSFFQRPLFKYFLTGITTAIFTLLTAFFIWSPNEKSKQDFTTTQKLTESKPKIAENRNDEELIVSKSDSKLTKRNQILNPIKIEGSILSDQINPPTTEKRSNPILSLCSVNPNSLRNYKVQSNTVNEIKSFEINNYSENTSHKSGISIEIRNSLNWNLPSETINPYKFSKFNGLGISLFYDLSNTYKIGLGIRQETFFVRYNSKNANQILSYEQQPNLTSYGILIDYSPELEIYKFRPDMLINFSGNYYGLICRGSLGLEYNFGNNLFGILQAEYSKMFFKHEINWFQANKISINYGIKFCF